MVFRGLVSLVFGLVARWLAKRGWHSRTLQALTGEGIETPHIWRSRAGFPAIFDVDVNLHMNNAAYVYAAELARWHWAGVNGLAGLVLKHRWAFIVGSQAIRYRRAIPPFAKYQVWTVIDGIDDKWMYMTHTFTSPTATADEAPKVIYAQASVRGLILPSKRGERVSLREAFAEVGASKEQLDFLEKRKPGELSHIQGFLKWDDAVDQSMKSFAEETAKTE